MSHLSRVLLEALGIILVEQCGIQMEKDWLFYSKNLPQINMSDLQEKPFYKLRC